MERPDMTPELTPYDSVTAGLRAQLDKDEAAAKAAAQLPGSHWDFTDGGQSDRERDGLLWDDDHTHVIAFFDDHLNAAAHAARHDPARVLREVEAKRAILAEHRPERTEYIDGDGDDRSSVDCSTCDNGGVPDTWPCPTIRALVSMSSAGPA